MTETRSHRSASTVSRGCVKIAAVVVMLGVVLGALITFVSRDSVNDLRHHLTLWLIIAIVAIINISAFLIFTVVWAAYRWIKRDFDPGDES